MMEEEKEADEVGGLRFIYAKQVRQEVCPARQVRLCEKVCLLLIAGATGRSRKVTNNRGRNEERHYVTELRIYGKRYRHEAPSPIAQVL